MINKKLWLKISIPLLILCFYVEYIHYQVVISQCEWPSTTPKEGRNASAEILTDPLKFIVITDIHLLGNRNTIWFERVVRDWELYRQFRTMINILEPEIIFILGDTFDEGLYLTAESFEQQVQRFKKLFSISDDNGRVRVVVGNHDIGFHYEISKEKNDLFVKKMDSPGVQLLTFKGNHFVLINSMALEGDNCFLCKSAKKDLMQIERKLKCVKGTLQRSCLPSLNDTLNEYSEPILMQHFPLYRPSDIDCDDFDAAPFPESVKPLKEGYDCLSKNSTMEILKLVEPRLVLSGHTHHGCTRNLPYGNGTEVTISSFNWRNKNNPSFGLGVVTPKTLAFIKCPLPRQSTMIILYTSGIVLIALWVISGYSRLFRRSRRKTLDYVGLL